MITNWFIQILCKLVAVLAIVCVAIPWMIAPIALIAFLLFLARQKLLLVAKEAMKLDQLSRSPISTVLGECLGGLTTIRAYERQPHFLAQYAHFADQNARAFSTFHFIVRAFRYYLDILSLVLVSLTVFAAFIARSSSNVLLLALIIQLVNDLLGSF